MHRVSARLISLLAVALLAAACGASGPSSVATTLNTPAPTAAPTTQSSEPPSQTASPDPAATPGLSAAPSQEPSASGQPTPDASGTPGASASAGNLAACSGTDDNREFLSTAAAAFTWDVYCAALPSGWFVSEGRYRGASGGWMEIFYKSSAGLRFELREGNFCSGTPSECAPLDTSLGSGPFGDQVGELGQYAGNYVIYVAPGTLPAYQATGVGLDEATFRSFLEALVKVPG